MRLKKKWTKPELRALRVPKEFDPAGDLTREQWEAARKLQRRAEEEKQASKADADADH